MYMPDWFLTVYVQTLLHIGTETKTRNDDMDTDKASEPVDRDTKDDSPRNEFIDIGRLFHALYQRRFLVLIVFGFSVGMSLLYLVLAPSIYSSTCLIELHTRLPQILGDQDARISDDLSRSQGVISDALNTQFHKMQSSTVRDQAAMELLKRAGEFPQLISYSQADAATLISRVVSFRRMPSTYLVGISAESVSPELAATIANICAKAAIDVVKQSTKATSREAVSWLQEQIEAYEKELLLNETRLISFRQINKIDGLNNAKETAEQTLVSINDSLVEYQTQAAVFADTVETLHAIEATPTNAGVLPSSIPRSDIVQTRLKEFIDLQEELRTLLQRLTDEHPKVVAMERLLTAARGAFDQEVARAVATAESDFSLVSAYVESLESNKRDQIEFLDRVQQQLNEFNTALIPLEREVEASDSSYKGLLERIEQARLSADQDTSVLTIYEYARPVASPVKPAKRIVLAGSGVLGLGAGVVIALLLHALGDRVYGVDDIEIEVGQRVLGVFPRIPRAGGTAETARLAIQDKFGPVAEAAASLRTSLQAQGHPPAKGGWVVLVSSMQPEEGKTSMSCNLGIAFARTNRKVLIVDGDMRRPRIHTVFGDLNVGVPSAERKANSRSGKGAGSRHEALSLMEVIMDESSDESRFDALPYASGVENLSCIYGHPVEGISPTEILATGRFGRFVEWARANFDVIVIDSPPLGLLSDAMVFAQMSDDVVWVSRCGVARKGALRRVAAEMTRHGTPLTGIVMNDFVPKPGGGLGRGYGYAYGYGRQERYYMDRKVSSSAGDNGEGTGSPS